jgi:hypothetical protein
MNTGTYATHYNLLPLFGTPRRNGNITRSVLNVVIYRPVRNVGLSWHIHEEKRGTGEMKAPGRPSANPIHDELTLVIDAVPTRDVQEPRPRKVGLGPNSPALSFYQRHAIDHRSKRSPIDVDPTLLCACCCG